VKVVLVGARSGRSEMADTALVNEIVDRCKEKYSNLIIIVASCDKGVGKIVKTRNVDPHFPGKFEFDMIELQLKHYFQYERSRSEFTANWIALNGVLVELGDEFHLLTEDYPKGAMADLVRRIKREGRPYALYKPSESKGGPKEATFDKAVKVGVSKETSEI
jgi:hypothetical protein